ncbi:cyclic nucleotide-binding domain-containing protein, partial [Tahibacter caeni]|uniref:cyclic nucleotide-binding domain-containing protein n=1 Tax=Tahibacter caeni TaxID=1453545 RepID=UPI0021475FBA
MAKASELYVDIPAGQYLFREGDAGAEMYIVESGSIAILRSARGNEPLAVLEPGDFLGEMAVLEDQPRFASALARTDARLLRIERAAFGELLRQNVEIAVRIMRKLALRQRRAEQRVSELQQELQQLRAASAAASAPSAPSPAAAPAPPVPPPAKPSVAPPAPAAPAPVAPAPVMSPPVPVAPAPAAPD